MTLYSLPDGAETIHNKPRRLFTRGEVRAPGRRQALLEDSLLNQA